jgi:adenine-specific DNA methylase
MKHMGSKRAMLQVVLGSLWEKELTNSKDFVDIFTGSAVVASSPFNYQFFAHRRQTVSGESA